jgi:hypothetical protein
VMMCDMGRDYSWNVHVSRVNWKESKKNADEHIESLSIKACYCDFSIKSWIFNPRSNMLGVGMHFFDVRENQYFTLSTILKLLVEPKCLLNVNFFDFVRILDIQIDGLQSLLS